MPFAFYRAYLATHASISGDEIDPDFVVGMQYRGEDIRVDGDETAYPMHVFQSFSPVRGIRIAAGELLEDTLERMVMRRVDISATTTFVIMTPELWRAHGPELFGEDYVQVDTDDVDKLQSTLVLHYLRDDYEDNYQAWVSEKASS